MGLLSLVVFLQNSMASSNTTSKSKKDPDQQAFEMDVRKIKAECDELKLVNEESKTWNYGKDPHKPLYNIGTRRSLPRACSGLIRKHLAPKWIPKKCKLDYCTLSKGINICCYNSQQYVFADALNLKELISKSCGLQKLDPQHQQRGIKLFMRDIIDDRTENAHLEVIINNKYSFKSYIKRVKQDRLAKSMDIAQVLFVNILNKNSKITSEFATKTESLSDVICSADINQIK